MDFLCAEGGAYPAVAKMNLCEEHDGRGIKIYRTNKSTDDVEILLSWDKVAKRTLELINAD